MSTIRAVTERHGEARVGQATPRREWPDHPGVEALIAERDGSLVAVVSRAEPRAGEGHGIGEKRGR